MLGRVSHPVFGLGFALSEHISGSGRPASVVVFDFNTSSERTVLDSYLSASKVPLPEIATTAKKVRKPRKPKVVATEVVSDELLVAPAPVEILPSLDPLPDDSSDYDDVGLLPDMGECTENEFIARNES